MSRLVKPIRIEGELAYVPLTKGYEAVIDVQDVGLVGAHNWCACVAKTTVYAIRTDRSGDKQRTLSMHRQIMGEPQGLQVDHKDGNGINNQRSNLREVTNLQNAKNRRLNRNNSTGFKGVTRHRNTGMWVAQIMLGNKQNYLGLFDTPEDAYKAYCEASRKLHGEFGKTQRSIG